MRPKKPNGNGAAKNKLVKTELVPVSEKDMAIEKLRGGVPVDFGDRWRYVEDNLAMAAAGTFKAGAALLTLKVDLKHGEFMAELERLNIGRSTAHSMMAVARCYVETYGKVKKLGATKLYHLVAAGITDQNYDPKNDTLDGIPVSDLDAMSTRELKTRFKAEKRKAADFETDNYELEKKLAKLEKERQMVPENREQVLNVCKNVRLRTAAGFHSITKIDPEKLHDDADVREALSAVAAGIVVGVETLQLMLVHPRVKKIEMMGFDLSDTYTWLKNIKIIDDNNEPVNSD